MSLIDKYDIFGIARLAVDVCISRLLFPGARVIRRPFYIRGKRYIKIGKGFTAGVGLRIDAVPLAGKECIELGRNVQVNDYVHIGACRSVKIGSNVLIGSKVFITDHNHGSYGLNNVHDSPRIPPVNRPLSYSDVTIEDNVWIGEFVVVLPGVKIGRGAVIGAMSVVANDIPPFCVAIGSPARVIKKYNFDNKQWEKI